MIDYTEQLLDEEEGICPTVYPDTLGFWTIARGCLVDPKVPGSGLCPAAIAAQSQHDSATARSIAARFPHFSELNDVRQAVLISMAYQLTTKPLHWPNFMAALTARDYAKAAEAGLDSDWARDQTPKRAQRAMQMLASGQWVKHA